MHSKKNSEMGLIAQEALDVGVTLAQKILHLHGCNPVVLPVGGGMTRFVFRIQGGEIRIQARILADTPTGQLTKTEG